MSTPYDRALTAIDAAHAEDPTKTTTLNSPEPIPYELHYAQRCTHYLSLLCPSNPSSTTSVSPQPSEPLRLAIRAQHFRRWEVPRSSYPMTRAGYHAWRTFLKKRQADLVAQICKDSGYDDTAAERVAALIRKEDLKKDEETQVLEDVACLVFLDDQLDSFEKDFAGGEEKIIGILRKSWAKMSPNGHKVALEMPMSERGKELVNKALKG